MLLPSYFIIDITRLAELPELPLPENARVAFSVTANNLQHINTFYKALFLSARHTPFTLVINLQDKQAPTIEAFENNLEYLIATSFHYAYSKINGDNPLFLFEATATTAAPYIASLKKGLTDQGYNNLETIIIDTTAAESKTIALQATGDAATLGQQYTAAIKNIRASGNTFFFYLDNPANITGTLHTIAQAEQALQQQEPQTYFLLKENALLAAQKQQLHVKATLLEERLDSLSNYHQHSNAPDAVYKKQVTELLNFYNTEYEVLPLWFKRLGQVVKVLTGKRTFKSLYNDNVKKYKTPS